MNQMETWIAVMMRRNPSNGGSGMMIKITLFSQQSTKQIISQVSKSIIATGEDLTDFYSLTTALFLGITNIILSVLEYGLMRVSSKS